ncbi:STAS domain-containing protein [cf. Phormidesmis sp. LEGE 11477]|uniref:STAS domain-containing protein n=1 Tax=cf. Phormidesmis sp. LEGE 11477 TaxID=1828680 RepID=UPI00187E478D|nr:STAS domain-containing protein [cf. Phormidesmis sp. LEGE 11477]MBE9063335.1 STAS domain-containing protein [cf. Phormidesmis sp. LEGE 11477]
MSSLNSPVTVVCPTGVLNAESASSFQQQLAAAMSAGKANELVVDMSKVESMDNAGLVSLMSALNAAKPYYDRLSIYSAPPSIRIVLELTQLDRLFTLVDQETVPVAA